MLSILLFTSMIYGGEMLFSPSELSLVSRFKSEEYLKENRREALRLEASNFFKIVLINERSYVLSKQKAPDRKFYDALDYRQLNKSTLELFLKNE